MATSLKIADEPLFTAADGRFKEECIAQYNANIIQAKKNKGSWASARPPPYASDGSNADAPEFYQIGGATSKWKLGGARGDNPEPYTKPQLRDAYQYGVDLRGELLKKNRKCEGVFPQKPPVSAQRPALFGLEKRKQFEGKTAQQEVGAWHAKDNGVWMYRENQKISAKNKSGWGKTAGSPIDWGDAEPVARCGTSNEVGRTARMGMEQYLGNKEAAARNKSGWGKTAGSPIDWGHRNRSARRQADIIGGFQLSTGNYKDHTAQAYSMYNENRAQAAINKGAWSKKKTHNPLSWNENAPSLRQLSIAQKAEDRLEAERAGRVEAMRKMAEDSLNEQA
jgi:hypothetical protein